MDIQVGDMVMFTPEAVDFFKRVEKYDKKRFDFIVENENKSMKVHHISLSNVKGQSQIFIGDGPFFHDSRFMKISTLFYAQSDLFEI